MINAAIAGLGRWGRNIVNAVQGKSERLRFSRCVVRRADAAREFAAQHGLQVSTDLDDVLTDRRVQAVVLATPHSLHVDQVIAAAAAGKAVFCEKPLALTRADAERAVEACQRAGVPLGIGHDKRFWPSMSELKRVAESAELGDILHVEGHCSNENSRRFPTGWRASPQESPGAGLTATGIHILDAFINLVGPVHRVNAQLVTRSLAGVPVDTLSLFLEFSNQVSGVLCGVRTTPLFWRVHVFGSNGSAEAVGDTELVLRMTDTKPRRVSFEPVSSLRLELDAFAEAVAGRSPYPISPRQMIDGTAALEAAVKSIELEAPVVVEA